MVCFFFQNRDSTEKNERIQIKSIRVYLDSSRVCHTIIGYMLLVYAYRDNIFL